MDKLGNICSKCRGEFIKTASGKRFIKVCRREGIKKKDIIWPKHIYHQGKGKYCRFCRKELKETAKKIYEKRDLNLLAMGYRSYGEYLKSDLWKTTRAQVLGFFGDKCHFCGRDAEEVHHSNYNLETLKGQGLYALFSLYPVCKECHTAGEYHGKDKVKPMTATKRMYIYACENGYGNQAKGRRKKREKLRKALHVKGLKQPII